MDIDKAIRFTDDNFNFRIGDYKLNIFYINFMPADPEWVEENHCHSTYELHIIPQGRGVLHTDLESFHIEKGDMYITGPGIYHRQTTDNENPMIEYCINFEMSGAKASNKNKAELFSDTEYNTLCETIKKTPFWYGKDEYGCVGIMEKIYTELTQKKFGYRSSVRTLIAQLLIAFVRNFTVGLSSDKFNEKTGYERRSYILDCRLYLDYNKPITINDISKSLFVSRRQACRIIEKRYGMTFKQKLNSIRIKNAKILLRETKLSVSEIATRIGFSSNDYFIRVFKANEGITPLKYRQKNENSCQ